MGKKSLHSGDSEEALAAKIQLLEEELASLKQSLHARHAINQLRASAQNPDADSDQDVPGPLNKGDGAIFDEIWVQETLRFLVKQQHPHSIQQVLRKVGSLLGLREIGLWNWDQQDAQLALLSQWCTSDLSDLARSRLQSADWLAFAVKPDSAERRHLDDGQALILSATDHDLAQVTEPLRQLGIFNSLIIPLTEQNQLRGLMTLHRDNPCTWYPQDAKALGSLLGWLFRFMQQHEQLRLMNDRDTRYQYAMEASNDGIWDWNLLTNKIYFSRSYLRMLGYDYEDLPGNLKTLQDYFVHPEDLHNMLHEYQAAIDNKRDSLQLQFRLLHRDSHIIWVNSKAKFFEPDHVGRPTRCVGVNTDITDFMTSREELLNAKAQADLASKTKSEFLVE
jgi:two-component system sensor histidine kinase/response regulator